MSDIVTEGIIKAPGAKLLYRSASGLEKAMADVDGERLIGTYAEIVSDQWDPYAISYNNLPYLAYAMGVLIWEEGWSESTQREWTARQFEYKALRGTQDGISMALHYSGRDFVGPQGYEIVQAIRPPQGYFASPSLSKAEYDFWIHLMPELRITFEEGVGWDGDDVLYVNDGGSGWHVGLDDGEALHGRKAYLRIRGVDTPLQIYSFTKTIDSVTSVDYERVAIPGQAGLAFTTEDFVNDEERFVCAEAIVPELVTIRVDGSYSHEELQLHLDTVLPGLVPLDVRYERESDVGKGNSFYFVNDWSDSRNIVVDQLGPATGWGILVAQPARLATPVVGDGALVAQAADIFAVGGIETDDIIGFGALEAGDVGLMGVGGVGHAPPVRAATFANVPMQPIFIPEPVVFFADAGHDAGRLLADRIFLYDENIVATITGGISFVGVDYVSWPAYTADLMINLHTDDDVWSWFADEGYTTDDNYFSSTVQLQDFDRSNRAVVTSQALRDRVRVRIRSNASDRIERTSLDRNHN